MLGRFLLWLALDEEDFTELVGDFDEAYMDKKRSGRRFQALLWYWKMLLKSMPSILMTNIFWRFTMFRNYVKVAVRIIWRQKGYAFINISGLALGMACCLLIMLWVFDELGFDRFHENAQTLYEVEQDFFYSGEPYRVYVTPYPMGPALKEEIPEIVEQTRNRRLGNVLVNSGEKSFFENDVRAVDPSFLRMFTFPLILGNHETALNEPHSLVVSESIAEKYFGREDPIGKIVTINRDYAFTVMGVFKDVPTNSSLQFDILVNFEITKEMGQYRDSWSGNSIITLVQLQENASIPEVNRKMTAVRHRNVAESISDPEALKDFNEGQRTQVKVVPLTDVHLRRYAESHVTSGAVIYVYVFSIIALVVLLIACINFTNLSTARSAGRAKEVGLRKVVGAVRTGLIRQFYSESILQTCLALIIAGLLTASVLPYFNTLIEKNFTLSDLLEMRFIVGMLAIAMITGLLAGSYPALFLSAFRPVKVLKGALTGGSKSARLRKILVIIQFTLSIFLIIGTGIVYQQLRYMRNMKLGYDKDRVIYIPLRGDTVAAYDVLKEELKNKPDIVNVSGSWQWPASTFANSGGADWEGKDPEFALVVGFNWVDFDYVETMKIELAEGRSFSKRFSTDTSGAFLINEAFQSIMGKVSAVNERLNFWGMDGKIIGVMKDYHFRSLHNEIEPLAISVNTDVIRYGIIRLASGDISSSVQTVQTTWERVMPNYPFEYDFLDEAVESQYDDEETIQALLELFTILAVLIACLGLFGLASFTAEQRAKEIGIRKVLGASIPGIMFLLSREFTKWVLISNIVAWPMAYYFLNNWLQNFAYRMNPGLGIFVFSGLMAFGVALVTVSYQSIKIAKTNPADTLHAE